MYRDTVPVIMRLLKIFKIASNYLVAEAYPTICTAVPIYNYILDKLEDFVEQYRNRPVLQEIFAPLKIRPPAEIAWAIIAPRRKLPRQ